MSLAAQLLAGVGLAVAGVVAAAHAGIAPGLQGALSIVPTWSHGPTVLATLHSTIQGSGSGGISIHLGL